MGSAEFAGAQSTCNKIDYNAVVWVGGRSYVKCDGVTYLDGISNYFHKVTGPYIYAAALPKKWNSPYEDAPFEIVPYISNPNNYRRTKAIAPNIPTEDAGNNKALIDKNNDTKDEKKNTNK